jgi:hypothetical protein
MEGSEADGELSELHVGAFLAPDARRRAPRQEFGIARDVGHEIIQLVGSEAHDAPLGMTRNHAAISP